MSDEPAYEVAEGGVPKGAVVVIAGSFDEHVRAAADRLGAEGFRTVVPGPGGIDAAKAHLRADGFTDDRIELLDLGDGGGEAWRRALAWLDEHLD